MTLGAVLEAHTSRLMPTFSQHPEDQSCGGGAGVNVADAFFFLVSSSAYLRREPAGSFHAFFGRFVSKDQSLVGAKVLLSSFPKY